METNPLLGVMIFALGGLAGAVFYMPFKKVKNWAWESYWMVYAVVGLVVVPWVLAYTTSPNVISVLRQSPGKTLAYCRSGTRSVTAWALAQAGDGGNAEQIIGAAGDAGYNLAPMGGMLKQLGAK